jgi:hypothetical protein
LFASLWDFLVAVVTANVFNKSLMAPTEMGRCHLPFAEVSAFSCAEGFTVAASLTVFPQLSIFFG